MPGEHQAAVVPAGPANVVRRMAEEEPETVGTAGQVWRRAKPMPLMPDRDQLFGTDGHRLPSIADDPHSDGTEPLAHRGEVLPPVVIPQDCQRRDVPAQRAEDGLDPIEVLTVVNDVATEDEQVRNSVGHTSTHDEVEIVPAGGAIEVEVAELKDGQPVQCRREARNCQSERCEFHTEEIIGPEFCNPPILAIPDRTAAEFLGHVDSSSLLVENLSRPSW